MIFTAGNILLIGSVLLFVSIIVGKTGYRFGVPALLLFLVVGMLFGSDGLGLQFHNAKEAQFIGITDLTISAICPLVWEVVSTNATLIDNMFEAFGATGVKLTGITVEKHPELNKYRFKSPYDNSYFNSLFGIGTLLPDDFKLPYIELDGNTYPGGYYITVTKLGWKMVNGVGPEANSDWGTFGSVYGNLSEDLGTYPLGSYNDAEKVFDLGALFFCIDDSGSELNYPLKGTTLLYLNN